MKASDHYFVDKYINIIYIYINSEKIVVLVIVVVEAVKYLENRFSVNQVNHSVQMIT